MEQERRAIRAGLTVILFAVAWRLLGGGVPDRVTGFFQDPKVDSFLVYLSTGRVVQAVQETDAPTVSPPEQTQPTQPTQTVTVPLLPELGGGEPPQLHNTSGCAVDAAAMLESTLEWELVSDAPTVLILHSHATESYTKTTQSYQESVRFRTLDTEYNMVRVGEQLAQVLENHGIGVIHDQTLHDYPSYTGAYSSSREAARKYLEQYPSIRLVLDLHRDAVELAGGVQMTTSAISGGADSAQLMLVVGTGSQRNPYWQENLSLAIKLHAMLEQEDPGITRPLYLRSERFNQDLLACSLLVEVGTAGDTLQEALVAAEALGEAIAALAHGANLA